MDCCAEQELQEWFSDKHTNQFDQEHSAVEPGAHIRRKP